MKVTLADNREKNPHNSTMQSMKKKSVLMSTGARSQEINFSAHLIPWY
jgi:hypothetical protein